MKKISPSTFLVFLIVLSIISFNSYAQDSTRKMRKMVFEARVYNMDNKLITENYLLQINDSSLLLGSNPDHFNLSPYSSNPVNLINYNDIGLVKVRRKGGAVRGAITGTIAGVLVGGLIGLMSGSDDMEINSPIDVLYPPMTAGEKALIGAGTLGLIGGLVGAIIGASAKQTFIINRNPSALKELNTTLLERLYVKQSN